MSDLPIDSKLLKTAGDWLGAGQAVALATVVATWGSSPRPVGSHLILNEQGEFLGSVSGGCVETALVAEGQATIRSGKARTVEFGVSNDMAWEVGLSCGGTIEVYVAPLQADDPVFQRLLQAQSDKQPVCWLIDTESHAHAVLVGDELIGTLPREAIAKPTIADLLKTERSDRVSETLFARTYLPPLRLLIVGAVHIAQHLAPMARMLGYAVTIVDPRKAFTQPLRFTDADLRQEWPDRIMEAYAPDARTAVVLLSHDPKFDDPALVAALRSPAFYIGALGSRRTHAQRLERMEALGFGEELSRIHAPIGLHLGGRAPAEIAVAIAAELVQARHGTPAQ